MRVLFNGARDEVPNLEYPLIAPQTRIVCPDLSQVDTSSTALARLKQEAEEARQLAQKNKQARKSPLLLCSSFLMRLPLPSGFPGGV